MGGVKGLARENISHKSYCDYCQCKFRLSRSTLVVQMLKLFNHEHLDENRRTMSILSIALRNCPFTRRYKKASAECFFENPTLFC